MWLIRAEFEGGQMAIDLVNELRAADEIPLVTPTPLELGQAGFRFP